MPTRSSHLPQHPPRRLPPRLKVASINVNGLRSALRKGLADWVEAQQPDVLLLQEVRAGAMPDALPGYHSAWFAAQKAGYSGVAILSRWPLDNVQLGMQHGEMDAEGRVISAQIGGVDGMGGVRFVSVYLPSGSSGPERQQFKERILGDFQAWVGGLIASGERLVVGGDYNIAHREIDLKNWRSNQKNSGFLPQEREWMTRHLAAGLTDTHRATLGEQAEYTWWSNRANAYANNVGWRIDYLLAAGVTVNGVRVDREARLSDHAPLVGWVKMDDDGR